MIKDIRYKLIELARQKTTWTYSQLNEQLELGLNFNNVLDRDLIGEWLGEVSVHEYSKGRPLLSALITHKLGKREQGDGFYKLCENLLGKDWEDLKADKNWENKMIADCYTFWLELDNYKKYKNDY
ncbi:hypothetical protein [uncultured Psychroserpens sp.]|uniref:hypothetical protein n=1 Tax=uncultured Psychroserpens sp. TaxID=255436 RepID=UPI0026082A42|nr:hypothetical protein [uncultured Psychroserpens sp.]